MQIPSSSLTTEEEHRTAPMEAIKSLKSYWRRQAYQRLEDVPANKKLAVVKLGAAGKRRRLSSKTVVVRPVMRLKKLGVSKSPKKVMEKLRDAYMSAVLILAGGSGGTAVWDRRIPKARQASSRGGHFEKRLMVHLYNSVIATR